MESFFQFTLSFISFIIALSSSEKNNKHNEVLGEAALSSFNFFDDQICLANFDVSEGSIIRTKDSLALGARYINVSELGDGKAKDDCLRLCCKTPHCNVITFEEKRSGSCYMFDCGPIDNFVCKFTDQVEFMSAILRKREPLLNISPHNQNRHEVELNQLRNSETEVRSSVGGTATMPETEESAGKQKLSNYTFTLDKTDNLNGGSRRCSRYQFECKSSGECIGIYNACDGISQCPDGSDEAAELDCPSVNGRPGIVVKGTEPKPIGSHKTESLGKSTGEASSTNAAKTPQNPLHHSQELHSAVAQAKAEGPQPSSKGAESNYEGQGPFLDKSRNGMEMPPQPNPNNIFSHKDGGVMDDSYGNQAQQRQNNPYNYWKSYDYGIGEAPGMTYSQAGVMPPQQGSNPQFYNGNPIGNPVNQMTNYGNAPIKFPTYGDIPPVPYNTRTQMFPPLVQQQYNIPNGGGVIPKNPSYVNAAPESSVAISNKVEGQHASQIETTVKPSLIGPLRNTSTTVTSSQVAQSPTRLPAQLMPDPKEIDDKILQSLLNKASLPLAQLDAINYGVSSESELPSPGAGAVLAFVAGLTMSIAMVAILTCRLRRVRMSSRRRGKNRLDPDYLVDGMYL